MQQYFSILKSKYDQESFTKFAHELLNDVEIGNVNLTINPAFNDHIESFYYLGSFIDPHGKNLHILDVNLKTNTKIEQARTMQRNLIARYLKDHWLDGALVAFHNDNASSWRLSYVKVEYKYDEKGKPTEELTPARRYSFLVGEGEPSHTAQMQLAKIYELTSQNPSLAQLEESFGVEKVTKEFFDKYRDLFESVVAELKSNHTFQNEASKNNIDTESFAKKLLGQIVFLYFLQKKGWLGVPKGKSWGEGDKMFLRNIYNQAISENRNFFNNYLEVLFYDTLNNARNDKVDRNYSDFFQSKVPFLNGGLFEPQYDWKNSMMYLDNRLFDKILGVFDTYNFTVKEDEPLEKEVAVDPEMLGKVFENLLEENLRKGKGTYYTPREIVHYMCEESLINFLATETNLEPDDVKNKYFPAYNKLGDEKVEVRDVSVSEKIIESLKNIKVVDPACGSGAFLVGMLQQITQLRNDLETRSKMLGTRDVASTEYEIKKQTIQNCIYGVDIDPGAIDIAKLRLWLSLVVDYDLEEIEPLPNLDYKLMQGNSLLEELVLGDTSIKLYDSEGIKKVMGSKRMKNLFDRENQIGLFDGDSDKVMKSLKSLQLKYFSTSDSQSKKEIRNKIEHIEHELIETSVKSSLENLKNQKGNIRIMPGIGILPEDVKRLEKINSKENQIFAVLEELNKTGTKPFFLWHLYFSDVFEEKGGFDVVIGNPPYIKIQNINEDVVSHYKRIYASANGKFDIYVLFIEIAFQLINRKGIISFIQPHRFLTVDYGRSIREFLANAGGIKKIINFGVNQIFETATTYTGVFFYSFSNSVIKYSEISKPELEDVKFNKISYDLLSSDRAWSFPKSDMQANILNNLYSNDLTLADVCDGIYQGIVTVGDDIFIMEGKVVDNYFYGFSKATKQDVKIEAELMKPVLKGEHIRRFIYPDSNIFVLYPHYLEGSQTKPFDVNIFENKYPLGYRYVSQFKDELIVKKKKYKTNPDYWYSLHRSRDQLIFEQTKILTPQLQNYPNFTLDTNSFFPDAGGYSILLKNDKSIENYKYYLGILNSKVLWFFILNTSTPFNNNYYYFKTKYLEPFRLPKESTEIKSKINSIVDELMNLRDRNNHDENSKKIIDAENVLNKLVYSAYDFDSKIIDYLEKLK